MNDLDLALAAARTGAEVIRTRKPHLAVEFKGDVDPVTSIDRASEARIRELLTRERPADGVLGEEQGRSLAAATRTWIVDPLDGTVNFVHGIPHVAVSIALYEGHHPLVGVVLDVFREEEFWATAGGGAWLGEHRLAVSTTGTLDGALAATGFPYDRREHSTEYTATFGMVLGRVQGLRRMGTASLDLAWVAAGRYDAFWEQRLAPWDVAAGLLLVREAGGHVTNREGDASTPTDPVFIASNDALQTDWRHLIDAALQT